MRASEPVPLTEGEQWAREHLQLLRAGHFTPRAGAGFVGASLRRAGETRRRRPDLAHQSRIWTAAGAAGWLALAGAGCEPFRSRIRAGLAWWGATSLMLDWHLGMVETPAGRPRTLGAADALTLSRAWLSPVALAAPTPLVCFAGFATDALDGLAARRLGEPTRAGRDLEGLADLSFAAAAIAGLRREGRLGALAAWAELARGAAGLAYTLSFYFGRAEAPGPALGRAARAAAPVRAGGLMAAAAGRRRSGSALTVAGCLLSATLQIAALRRRA